MPLISFLKRGRSQAKIDLLNDKCRFIPRATGYFDGQEIVMSMSHNLAVFDFMKRKEGS